MASREIKQSQWGLIGGVIVAVAFAAVAALAVVHGQSLLTLGIVILEVGSLAGVFVYGTRSRRDERIKKAQVMTDELRPPPAGGGGESA